MSLPVIQNELEDKMERAARRLSYNDSTAEAEAKFRLFEGAGEIRKLKRQLAEIQKIERT